MFWSPSAKRQKLESNGKWLYCFCDDVYETVPLLLLVSWSRSSRACLLQNMPLGRWASGHEL